MKELRPWLGLLLRRRKRLATGALLMFMTLGAGASLLALSGWFITATALTGLLLAAGTQATLNIYTPGGGIRFLAIARTVTRYLERLYNHDTVLRLVTDIRVRLFSELSERPPGVRRERRAADWLTRLTRDVNNLDALFLQLIAPPGIALLSLVLASLLLAAFAPLLLLALLPLWLLPVVLAVLSRRTLQQTRNAGDQEQALRARLIDALEGQAELHAAHLWHKESQQLLADSEQIMTQRDTAREREAVASGITVAAVQLATVLALVLALLLWREGALSGPVALMLSLGVLGLGEAFLPLPAAFSQLGATAGAAGRLNADGGGERAVTSMPLPTIPSPIELVDVSLHRNGEPVFSAVSLRLEPGQRIGVLGRSGSGKSSLLDILAGLVPQDTGSVTVSSQTYPPGLALPWARQRVYLQQRTYLFRDSLRANLQLADPEADDDRLLQVLRAVALEDLVSKLPLGLDSPIGDQGHELSGGERRRLALARALLHPGWLVILDEPLTGVDEPTCLRITERIEPWLANRTCIMAAHNAAALPRADLWLDLDRPLTGIGY